MLIKCPECGKDVSDKATACIHCGYPFSNIQTNEKQIDQNIILKFINNNDKMGAVKYLKENFDMLPSDAIKYVKEFESKNSHRIQKVDNRPKCPTCGSHNIQPISATKRAGSLLTFGLASGSIGKSYECKNCKYKW